MPFAQTLVHALATSFPHSNCGSTGLASNHFATHFRAQNQRALTRSGVFAAVSTDNVYPDLSSVGKRVLLRPRSHRASLSAHDEDGATPAKGASGCHGILCGV